jgi:hypothetical protein
MTELQKTFMAYPKDEQMYMLELDKMSKVDLILWLNNLNNIRKKELDFEKPIDYDQYTTNYLAVLHNDKFGYWIEYDGGKINLRDMIINSFEKQLAKSNNELKTKN